MIILNERMRKYLRDSDIDFDKETLNTLHKKCPDFVEINECVVIQEDVKEEEDDDEEDQDNNQYYYDDEDNDDDDGEEDDKTGIEASWNEFRFEDYFEEFEFDLKERSVLSIKFAYIIGNKLKKCFPSYTFYIIVVNNQGYHNMRFHKYRENEYPWLDMDGLDEYNEKIAVVIL